MRIDYQKLEDAGVRLAPVFSPASPGLPCVSQAANIADRASPADIVDAVTRLVGHMPPGWSLTDVRLLDRNRIVVEFQPVLERRLVEDAHDARVAKKRADEAQADAAAAFDRAERTFEKLLNLGNREKPQPTLSVAGVDMKPQDVTVSD